MAHANRPWDEPRPISFMLTEGELRLRATVACFILDDEGRCLAGVKLGGCNHAFRCLVQGGVDEVFAAAAPAATVFETALETAYREMFEEVGITKSDVEFLSVILPSASKQTAPHLNTDVQTLMDEHAFGKEFKYLRREARDNRDGQVIIPLLFRLRQGQADEKVRDAQLCLEVEQKLFGADRSFCRLMWCDLEDMGPKAPRKKVAVMSTICAALKGYLEAAPPSGIRFPTNEYREEVPITLVSFTDYKEQHSSECQAWCEYHAVMKDVLSKRPPPSPSAFVGSFHRGRGRGRGRGGYGQ